MALSRQDVIISCVVAFLSWTFLSHLIPTLRWVPYAFVTSSFITLSGFLYIICTTSISEDYYVLGSAIAPTSSLAFASSPTAWIKESALLKQRLAYRQSTTYDGSSHITSQIDKLIESIIRDFIESWHSRISNDNSFSNEVDGTIREAIRRLIARIRILDLSDIGVLRLLPVITAHFKTFTDAERAVRGNRDLPDSDELDAAIAARYKDGKLHPATSALASDTVALQQNHLRRVVGRLLPELLPETMITSNAVLVVVREIISCAVISPVVQMLADPDTLHQLIEAYVSLLQENPPLAMLILLGSIRSSGAQICSQVERSTRRTRITEAQAIQVCSTGSTPSG